MSDDDASLLRQFARTGSDAAFTELVRRHIDLVHSAALRQMAGDTHRAQDVTQAVFAELAAKASRLGHHPSLAGWLYTTARFVAARAQRAERRRLDRERLAHAMDEAPTPAGPDWDGLKPLLDEAMHRLNAADREAVVLRFFQGRPLAAIGSALGVTENAARMRVDRALDKLRAELARRGIASTGGALAAILGAHAAAPAPAGLAATVVAAAGAVPAAATLGVAGVLAEVAVFLMTAKKWLALGALAVATAVMLPRLRPPPPSVPEVEVRFRSSSPAETATGLDLAAGFNWAAVETEDYRRFIANLRASGAPERLVRDVVALELYRAYLPRYRETTGPEPERAYWQKAMDRPMDLERRRRDAETSREMRAVLQSLFGPEVRANDAVDILHIQPDLSLAQLAWLPPDVAGRVAAVLEPLVEAEQAEQGHQTYADRQRQLERRLKALRGLLTPEQAEEYRWRTDARADTTRTMTRHWEPTEAEFRKLAEQDPARDNELYAPTTQMEDLRKREAAARQVLGTERTPDFIKATDLSYGYALELGERMDLPADTADRVWELKQETLAEDERLRRAGGISPEERRQRRAALTTRARDGMVALVGPDGLRTLRQDWPWWKSLETPLNPIPSP